MLLNYVLEAACPYDYVSRHFGTADLVSITKTVQVVQEKALEAGITGKQLYESRKCEIETIFASQRS